MNSYRLNIVPRDERWDRTTVLVRAESRGAALDWGEARYPHHIVVATEVAAPVRDEPTPEVTSSGIWGFARAELELVQRALEHWSYVKEQVQDDFPAAEAAKNLRSKIRHTLDMEMAIDRGPF
jgi:hypothetical protein